MQRSNRIDRAGLGCSLMLGLGLFLIPMVADATASPPLIPPRELRTQSFKAGAYAGPTRIVLLATSAQQWVHEGQRYGESTPKELTYLVANGFDDGAMEFFRDKQREGVYDGQAFATARGAADETRRSIAWAEKHFERKGLRRSSVAGVPGGVLIGNFDPGEQGATGNVFFSVGRCAFLVADRVMAASDSVGGSRPAIDAARRIARRAGRICG